MPKVSQDHKDERRDHILASAARCFARQGFHATSVADVIAESGLSTGSVYRYFKNKEELIAAIIEHFQASIFSRFLATANETSTPAEIVTNAISIIDAQLRNNHESLIQIMPQIWAEGMRTPTIRQRGVQLDTQQLEQFEQIVRRSQDQGTVSTNLNPAAVAQIMLALIQGYLLQGLFIVEDINAERYTQTVRQLLSATPVEDAHRLL